MSLRMVVDQGVVKDGGRSRCRRREERMVVVQGVVKDGGRSRCH